MKFFYDMADTFDHNDYEYYTESDIDKIHFYEWTEALEKESEKENSTLWCVFDSSGYSWEFANCVDIIDAKLTLMYSLNQNVYERIHDI